MTGNRRHAGYQPTRIGVGIAHALSTLAHTPFAFFTRRFVAASQHTTATREVRLNARPAVRRDLLNVGLVGGPAARMLQALALRNPPEGVLMTAGKDGRPRPSEKS